MLRRLEVISKHAWGFENWFQVEFILALYDSGVVAEKVLGKKKYDADIIVDGKGIELKAHHSRHPGENLIKAFSKHKRADSYLFLAQKDNRVERVLKGMPYPYETRDLGEDWLLIFVEKTKGCEG